MRTRKKRATPKTQEPKPINGPPQFNQLMEAIDQALLRAQKDVHDDVFSGGMPDIHAYGLRVGTFQGIEISRQTIYNTYKAWVRDSDGDEE